MRIEASHYLPNNWQVVLLIDIVEVNPRLDKSTIPKDLPISFVPMASVEAETGRIALNNERRFSEVQQGYTPFKEDDILFAKITPCMENGKMAIAPSLINDLGFGSTEFHVLRPTIATISEYIYYYISSKKFRVEAERHMTGAVGQRRVPSQYFHQCEIPLPPLAEQHRIVAKIEELFSELDKGVESLKTALEQLRVYRQSLLKYAFEGKLTEKWRAENPDKLETAEQLLARIRREREERFTKELADWEKAAAGWEAEGKKGKKPAKPKKPKELPPLTEAELAELPELPEGWGYLRINELCDVVRGGSPRPAGDPKYYGGDIPFLKVADLTRNANIFLQEHTHTIKESGLSKTRFINPNTLLISNSGATLGVPKICLIHATFNDGIAAFLGLSENVLKYHYYFWLSKTTWLRGINQGAAQPNLNTDLIGSQLIPICGPHEMRQISVGIEQSLLTIDLLCNSINHSLQQSDILRQSILKKAFSGQLVPQDPNDEPAAALLERIRAEKAGSGKSEKKNQTKTGRKKGQKNEEIYSENGEFPFAE